MDTPQDATNASASGSSSRPSEDSSVALHRALHRSTIPLFGRPLVCETTGQPASSEMEPSAELDDDEPPPLASGSDSELDGHEVHHGHLSDSSMPTLQTVSDSSDTDLDASDEDESVWGDEHDHNVQQHPIPAEGSPSQTPYVGGHHWRVVDEDEDSEDDDDEDDEDEETDEDEDDWEDADLLLQNGDLATGIELLLRAHRSSVDNDPLRAETLLEGLESVSHELVRRYEKLRQGDGDDGEGCAICRDDFIRDECADSPDLTGLTEVDLTCALFAALPFHPSPQLVVAFPCPGRHLFHNDCLAPWLARKTTCPSCRCDIDPDSLTLRVSPIASGLTSGRHMAESARKKWQPPRMSNFATWLDQQEQIRAGQEGGIFNEYVGKSTHADQDDVDNERETEHAGSISTREILLQTSGDSLTQALPSSAAPATTAMQPRPSRQAQRANLAAILAMLGSSSRPGGLSSMNIHDSALEHAVVRALQMARSTIPSAQDLPPAPPPAILTQHDHSSASNADRVDVD